MQGKVTEDFEIYRFCPEHISYKHGGILMELHRNVSNYEKLCHVHEPGLYVKGLGHNHRSFKKACHVHALRGFNLTWYKCSQL
jgi:hypothetical protein